MVAHEEGRELMNRTRADLPCVEKLEMVRTVVCGPGMFEPPVGAGTPSHA
jgi:hypothetical protein